MRAGLFVCAVAAILVSCSSGDGASVTSTPSDAAQADAPDAAIDAPPPPVDAPVPAPDGTAQAGIPCPPGGPAACPAGDLCCVSGNPDAGPQTDVCQPAEAGSCAGTPVGCSQSSECDMGLACCGLIGNRNGNVTYEWVRCVSPIVWGCDDVNTVRFCNPSANDCPASEANCVASQLLVGFHTCRP